MLTLIKGAYLYTPDDIGIGDVLLGYGKIMEVAPQIDVSGFDQLGRINHIQGDNLVAIPGMIDLHVHFLGGGGASGPVSRSPEIGGAMILPHGITTAVGIIGMDHITRSLYALYGMSRTVEDAGLSTYMYTGGFVFPSQTLTGSVRSDLVLIDKVIGVKVALADATGSRPSVEELTRLACDAYAGGLLSGKAGVLYIHQGQQGDAYQLLEGALDKSGVPPTNFIVCHLNYSSKHLDRAIKFAARKTFMAVDSTLNPALDREGWHPSQEAIPPADSIDYLLKNGVSSNRLILQSDTIGGIHGLIDSLLMTVRELVIDHGHKLNEVLRLVTTNPAAALGLTTDKGALAVGADGDVVLLDRDFKVHYVFSKGKQKIPQMEENQ